MQLALDKRKWKKKKTAVKKKTLNPYYNESFVFDVSFNQIQVSLTNRRTDRFVTLWILESFSSCLQRVNLVISVWDHDAVTRNDAIGKIFLGCDAAGNQLRHWADMLSNPRRPVAQWHSLLSSQQINSSLTLKKRIPLASKLPLWWHNTRRCWAGSFRCTKTTLYAIEIILLHLFS